MNINFSEIIEFLKEQDIKYKYIEDDNVLYLPYIINNIRTDVIITVSNKVVMLIVNIDSLKDENWCNDFNLTHIIPRASINKSNQLILDCIYDLNIFPIKYIKEWFKISLAVCLSTVKNDFTQDKKNCPS